MDADVLMDHIEEFLTGATVGSPTDRMLATVLFTDIVDSTATAQAMGDDTTHTLKSVADPWQVHRLIAS